eukprot:SAG31_NODE_1575_length_7841_cov_3.083958_4_plen_79_part_00
MSPANWSLARAVTACEQLCASADECIGFTLNPSAAEGGNPAVRAVTFSFLCPLSEKYGTFIARCSALIEKVSSFRVNR